MGHAWKEARETLRHGVGGREGMNVSNQGSAPSTNSAEERKQSNE
jgi:hypothetical protein